MTPTEADYVASPLHELARRLMPIADRFFERADHLTALGFRKHIIPHGAFAMLSPEEQRLSRLVDQEIAREIVTCNTPHYPMPLRGFVNGYRSPLLEKLRTDRIEAGLTDEWFRQGGTDVWKFELDPFRRKERQLWYTENARYMDLQRDFLEAKRKAVAEEVENLRTSESDTFLSFAETNSSEDRRAIFLNSAGTKALREFFGRKLAPIGFTYKRSLQSGNCVLYSRPLTAGYELRIYLRIFNGEITCNFLCAEINYQSSQHCYAGIIFDPDRGLRYVEIQLEVLTHNCFGFCHFSSPGEFVSGLLAYAVLISDEADFIADTCKATLV